MMDQTIDVGSHFCKDKSEDTPSSKNSKACENHAVSNCQMVCHVNLINLEEEPRFGSNIKYPLNQRKVTFGDTWEQNNNNTKALGGNATLKVEEKVQCTASGQMTDISKKVLNIESYDCLNAEILLKSTDTLNIPEDKIEHLTSDVTSKQGSISCATELDNSNVFESSEDVNASDSSQSSTEITLHTTVRHSEEPGVNKISNGIQVYSKTVDANGTCEKKSKGTTSKSDNSQVERSVPDMSSLDHVLQSSSQLPAIHNFFPDANFSKYTDYLSKQDAIDVPCHSVEQAASHDSSGYISGVSIIKEQVNPTGGSWSDAAVDPCDQGPTEGATGISLSTESSFNSDLSETVTSSSQRSCMETTKNESQERVTKAMKTAVAKAHGTEQGFSASRVKSGQDHELAGPSQKSPAHTVRELQQDPVFVEINNLDRRELEKYVSDVTCMDGDSACLGERINHNEEKGQCHVMHSPSIQGLSTCHPIENSTHSKSGSMIHLQHWQSMPMNSIALDMNGHSSITNGSGPEAIPTVQTYHLKEVEILPRTNNPLQYIPATLTEHINQVSGPNIRKIQVVCNKQEYKQNPVVELQTFAPQGGMIERKERKAAPSCSSSEFMAFDNIPNQYVVQNPGITYLASPTQLVAGCSEPAELFQQPGYQHHHYHQHPHHYHPPYTVESTIEPTAQACVSVTKIPGQRTVDYIDTLLRTCDASNYIYPKVRPPGSGQKREAKKPRQTKQRRARSRGNGCPSITRTPEQELEFIRSYQNHRKRGGGSGIGIKPKYICESRSSVGIQCNSESIDETSRWLQEYCCMGDLMGPEVERESLNSTEMPAELAWEYSYNSNGEKQEPGTDSVDQDLINECSNHGENKTASLISTGVHDQGQQCVVLEEGLGNAKQVEYINQANHMHTTPCVGMQFANKIAKARPNTIIKYSEQIIDCNDTSGGLITMQEYYMTPVAGDVSKVTVTTLSDPVSESSNKHEEGRAYKDNNRPDGDALTQVEFCDENPIPEVLNSPEPASLCSQLPKVTNDDISLSCKPSSAAVTSDMLTSASTSATSSVPTNTSVANSTAKAKSELTAFPTTTVTPSPTSVTISTAAAAQTTVLTAKETCSLIDIPLSAPILNPISAAASSPFLKVQILSEAGVQSPTAGKNVACEFLPMTSPLDAPIPSEQMGNLSELSVQDSAVKRIPDTPLLIDEGKGDWLKEDSGADVEGQGCQPSVTEYDEDHRFEDQEYVTSFIKSFRNNPRRYKAQGGDYQVNRTGKQGRCTRASKSEGQQVSELLKYINGLNGQVKKLNKRPQDRPCRTKSAYVRQRTKPLDLSNKPKKSRAVRKVKATKSDTSTRNSTGGISSSGTEQTPGSSRCNSSTSTKSLTTPVTSPIEGSPTVKLNQPNKRTKSSKPKGNSRALKRKCSDSQLSNKVSVGVKRQRKGGSTVQGKASNRKKTDPVPSKTSRCLRSSALNHSTGQAINISGGDQYTAADSQQPLDLSVKRKPEEIETDPLDLMLDRSQHVKTSRTVSSRKGGQPALTQGYFSHKTQKVARGQGKNPGKVSSTGSVGDVGMKRKPGRPRLQSASAEAVRTTAVVRAEVRSGGKQRRERLSKRLQKV